MMTMMMMMMERENAEAITAELRRIGRQANQGLLLP